MKLVVFDLDDTLYSAASGVFARMDRKINDFLVRELGLTREQADRLRRDYWQRYGTTLRGLMLHYGVDPESFLHEVHDVRPEELLAPDAVLDRALAAIPARKVVHTNGIREHAERVLAALGVRHHFEAIYDIRLDDYRPKPNEAALARILREEGALPHETLVVDDQPANLAAAAQLGCRTVLVGTRKGRWRPWIPSVHRLPAWLEQVHAQLLLSWG